MAKSLEEIANVVECEGLDYALLEGYLKPEDFEDAELSNAAKDAIRSLKAIDEAILPHMP